MVGFRGHRGDFFISLKYMTITNQLINLNSANATQLNSTYLSNVYFKFPSLIVPKNNIKSITCSVLNAQIPYSYYNVNVYNNIFLISNGGATQTITLTRGNYNANSLITEIIGQLTLAGITGISIVLSSVSGCLTWTTSAASMTIYATGSTALRFLGLNTTTNTTSVSQKIISPYPLNLLYTLKIRIASTALNNNHLDSSVSGSLNILSSFSVSAANFGIILYENQTNIQSELKVRDLNGFDIRIIDDDGNLINFNNTNLTATMMFQIETEVSVLENPFLPNLGIPNQQYWGAQPNVISAPNITNDISKGSSGPDFTGDTNTTNIDNSNATETQTTADTTAAIPEEQSVLPNDTAGQLADAVINLPETELNPNLDSSNDLAILLWNKHINL